MYPLDSVTHTDGIVAVKTLAESSVHLILSDIPYGIGVDEWDVLHSNTNSAFLGTSPAQVKAGAVFKRRGKPLNGWSEADRRIPSEYQHWCESFAQEWLRVLKPAVRLSFLPGVAWRIAVWLPSRMPGLRSRIPWRG
jgi:site-specific DNA-methyltransferase (adenine-specific)